MMRLAVCWPQETLEVRAIREMERDSRIITGRMRDPLLSPYQRGIAEAI